MKVQSYQELSDKKVVCSLTVVIHEVAAFKTTL